MKKLTAILLCLFLLVLSPVTAQAAEGAFTTAGDLYEAWCQADRLPDYLTGVWSTDGGTTNLTFGVLDSEEGRAGEEKILSLVRDDSTVTIVYQKYSLNYLYTVQEAVEQYFDKDVGMVSVGVDMYGNRLQIEIHTDYQDDPDTQAMMAALTEQYGDAVYFCDVSSYLVAVDSQNAAPTEPFLVMAAPGKQLSMPLDILLLVCVIAGVCLFFLERQRRRLAAVRAGGSVTAVEKPLTTKAVEEKIQAADPDFPPQLDDRILETVRTLDAQ